MLARLGGDGKARIPSFDEERAKVDRLLDGTPRRVYDADQAALIAALGLRG